MVDDATKTANRQIKYGGRIFNFPADATDDEVVGFFNDFRNSDQFIDLVDKKRGASALVRDEVGRYTDPQERLQVLQKHYSDVQPYGEDNFIVQAKDGTFHLYNEEGFSMGDVASVGREISETAFSGLFGYGGAVTGLGTGPGAIAASPTLGYAGAVFGAEFGAKLWDAVTWAFGTPPKPQTAGEAFAESGSRAALTLTGEFAGPLAYGGFRRIMGATTKAQELAIKFKELGIDPIASAISEGPGMARMESGLQAFPSASNTLFEQASRVVSQTEQAAKRIASQLGDAQLPFAAGETLQEAAKKSFARFRSVSERLYTDAFEKIGANTLVFDVEQTRLALEPYQASIGKIGEELEDPAVVRAVRYYEKLVRLAENGNLPFDEFRRFRTNLRRKKDAATGDLRALYSDLYDGLTIDMSKAAQDAGSDAAQALKEADAFYRDFQETSAATLQKMIDYDAPARAFDALVGSGKNGPSIIRVLRKNFTAEEWGDVAASVVENMGRATDSAQDATGQAFSVSTFMTNWARLNRAGPETVEAMFNGSGQEELVAELLKLVDVVDSLKNVERVRNVSNTAGALQSMMIWQTLGSGSAGAIASGGDLIATGASAAGGVVAPWAAAKLMTSPAFVRWLATPPSEIGTEGAKHIAKLYLLAENEPDLADAISDFANALVGQSQREVQ